MKTTSHPTYFALLVKLKARRRALNWTQTNLGAVLKRPQAYVAKVEAGEQRVDLIEFYYWAKALQLDPSVLTGELFADLDTFLPLRRRRLIDPGPQTPRKSPSGRSSD